MPECDPGAAGASPAAPQTDSGLESLVFSLQLLGLAADADQIRHAMGLSRPFAEVDLLRAAKAFPVKIRAVAVAPERLENAPMPAIAEMNDGRYLVVGRIADAGVLVQEAGSPTPRHISKEVFLESWSGRLILLSRRASLSNLQKRFDFGWFMGAVGKYKGILGEVLIASFFLQLLTLVTPLFFQVLIDKVLVHRGLSTLDVLMVGLGVLSVFEVVLGGLRTYIFAHTTNRIDVELGARLFHHLLALPLAYFETRRVGDSVARVRELETIRQFLTSSALTLVIDLVFTSVFLAVMFSYSVTLTWIVVGAFPFYIALSWVITPMFRERLDEKFRCGAENQSFLVENVTGVATLKAMALEPQMQRRWEESLAAYVSASFASGNLGNWANQIATLVNKVTVVATLFFGARLVITNDLSVGELVAFNMLAGNVSAPVLRLAQLWQEFQQVRVSVDRLGDILNTAPEFLTAGQGAGASVTPPPIHGDIRFQNVTFRYRIDVAPVLSDLSLSISAGQVIGIVGPSGSGKSTLAKLMQRLYVPESGNVFVDGVDIMLADPAWLRRQIGVVLQDNILFNRSVRDNIALADPTMAMERVIAAAQLAGAHDFILGLPSGYDTVIGERGTALSGGQRQRIAIARAIITDPRILIFDEATSALDYESESIIRANMKRMASGRTVILIAHRLSTVASADRIITIERGRIVEDGTHEQLVRAGGRYASLLKLQTSMAE
ncbi:MAG: type I secretion system permease/ATPase [Alphaproteobacteria bacterium]|nr:type I secretion system permease/ATPase [Alphaproteobacteria bacterium]MBF0129190.1 type I secretion system permease/ATPase [Alphaproteobacteria bacterium]